MRNVLFILIAVLLLPCCVHQSQNGVRSLLKEAEGMIRTSPDTAYFLLREMEASMDLQTKADSAYHGLLLMEAQAKNGIKLTDTTSLEKLTHYYKERQDSLMQIRLLRLRGLAHRDGGRYEEAVKCYNAAIGEAKQMDEKRLLADMYYELARFHHSVFLIWGLDSCKRLSDSLFTITIRLAKELDDSVLLLKSLITPASVLNSSKQIVDYEQQLLQALELSVALKDSAAESKISTFLSILSSEKGDKGKALAYVRRSLSLRKGCSSEAVSYIALGNTYQRIGMWDSAAYYLRLGKELQGKENFTEISAPVKEAVKNRMSSLAQWMQQHEELKSQSHKKRMAYVGVICLLVVLLGWGAFYLKKLKHHEAMEKQRKNLQEEKGELTKEHTQIKEQLAEKEALLTQKQKEIQLLQQRLESLSSDVVHVLVKAKQIISDKQHEIKTNLKMEDSDWLLLLQETDSRLNGALTRIQKEYKLSDKEVRLCCLFLTDIPVSHLYYLFERSRSYLYRKMPLLFHKLGIECDSSTYKETFQSFIANLK